MARVVAETAKQLFKLVADDVKKNEKCKLLDLQSLVSTVWKNNTSSLFVWKLF